MCVCLCFFVYLCFSVSDLGVVRVLESQAKVVPLQQVQMATHHVQQGLALGKFLLHTHTQMHMKIYEHTGSGQVTQCRFRFRHRKL